MLWVSLVWTFTFYLDPDQHTVLSSVILNLKSSLEEIDIEETNISVDKLLQLRSIPTLIVLNHSFEDLEGGQFSGFIRKNIEIAT